jgi:hypothetical protein
LTKVHIPDDGIGTIESALWECINLLGAKRCADLIEKEITTLYRYADKNDDKRNLQAKYTYVLDSVCYRRTGITPFANLLRQRRSEEPISYNTCLKTGIEDALMALGEVARAEKSASCPNGPGGTNHTPDETRSLIEKAQQLITEAEKLKTSITSHAKPNLKEVSNG